MQLREADDADDDATEHHEQAASTNTQNIHSTLFRKAEQDHAFMAETLTLTTEFVVAFNSSAAPTFILPTNQWI